MNINETASWAFESQELFDIAVAQVVEDIEETVDSYESGWISEARFEEYLNWLAGADNDLTADELDDIKAIVFSKDADAIHATATTCLGARA